MHGIEDEITKYQLNNYVIIINVINNKKVATSFCVIDRRYTLVFDYFGLFVCVTRRVFRVLTLIFPFIYI